MSFIERMYKEIQAGLSDKEEKDNHPINKSQVKDTITYLINVKLDERLQRFK